MNYRYQEVLTWIVPGFYLIAYVLGATWIIIPCDTDIDDWKQWIEILGGVSNALMALMLFAVPIISLVVGWMINGAGGYLFRRIKREPIVNAYRSVINNPNATQSEAEEKFNLLRETVNLDKLDRFYYRYVFSRNMFTAQGILSILSIVLLMGYLIYCCSTCQTLNLTVVLLILVISVLMLFGYWKLVKRDLFTHAKYVFRKGVKKGIL